MNLTLELTAEQLAELARQVAPLVVDEITERGGPSPWLSLADGAAYLCVSERTLEREITRGRLRSSTLADCFTATTSMRWREAATGEGTAPTAPTPPPREE
jgi:hypothetical protein